MKMPMPACSMLLFTRATSHSTSTPRVSRMSAAPHIEVMARQPCLAMQMPSAAATSEAAVLMLKVLMPSMPVPQFSASGPHTSGRTLTVSISYMACHMPAISSALAPLAVMAARNAPCCRSGCSFFSICPKRIFASSRLRSTPRISLSTRLPKYLRLSSIASLHFEFKSMS